MARSGPSIRFAIRVKPKAKRASVTEAEGGGLVVAVHAAPTDGQANQAVIQALARHFGVTPSRIRIVRGLKHRTKVVDIIGQADG